MVIHAEKREGETPLELIDRLREEGQIRKDEKATYAGRLDPMASGAMVILTSEDVHRKEEYTRKDKEYEVEVLFGFATDSYDILGKLEAPNSKLELRVESDQIQRVVKSFVGKFIQEYPRYSSKVIAMNELPDEMPSREVEIYSLDYLGEREVSSDKLLSDIKGRIAKVKGDFRQQEILDLWNEHLGSSYIKYAVAQFMCRCSSGTYMRVLAHELGKKLGVPALAYSIRRTKVL